MPVLCILDNVDRCGLRPKALTEALTDLLDLVDPTRVCLVLGCRTTDWPGPANGQKPLESKLSSRLPGFSVRHLLALSRREVSDLASARGLDPDEFLDAVVRFGAMPLACTPQTTHMLIAAFKASGKLSSEPAHLFETALMELAREPDPHRVSRSSIESTRPGLAAHRLDTAAKIATRVSLCARTSIQSADMRAEQGDLSLAELIGDDADEEAIRDALSSALFTPRGPARRMLRHPSFTAYFTARYLASHAMREEHLRNVLLGPSDAVDTVRPLLRETAAWLVALDPDAYRWILDTDAETVAAYPYAMASAKLRPLLVDGLLNLAGQEALRNYRLTGYALSSLTHPELEQQLRTAIAHGPAGSRRTAAEIAQATGAVELCDDLATLARDETQPAEVRVRAVRAIGSLAPLAAGRHLRPVLLNPDDPLPDELRGRCSTHCGPTRSPRTNSPKLSHPSEARSSTACTRSSPKNCPT